MELSIISPIYKGELMLDELISRIECSVRNLVSDYEIILVNDASPDNSWNVISDRCKTDKKIKAVNLSRNFGQDYAITAGLSVSSGTWVVVMDCDLQDQLEEIPFYMKKQRKVMSLFLLNGWREKMDI
jgi:glycosyltransferase involved in cell wall biosynthesis